MMKKTVKSYIPILMVMLFWGSMGIPSTYAVEELDPLAVLCLRSGIATVVLFPIVLHRHGTVRPAQGERILLLLLSAIGVVGCNYLYFFAVQHTALTNVAILYAVGPIVTTILAAVCLREKIYQSRILGIGLAFAGVVLLMTDGHMEMLGGIDFSRGDIAELLSSFCLALYTLLSRKLHKTPADCAAFWLMLIAFVITLPAVLMTGGLTITLSGRAMASVLYLGILCSGLGYLLQQKSIQTVGASASSAFLNGISPITILTAALLFHEKISPVQIGCIAVVFLGLFLNAKNTSLTYKKKIV